MRRLAQFVLACFAAGHIHAAAAATNVYSLAYTQAPPANPLKGFMPYSGNYTTFPYSMEWNYVSLRSLMTGPTNFTWSSLDNLLQAVAARGHHTVFRVYLDYPGKSTGIPQYLLDAGLATYSYNDHGNNGKSLCPDYKNPLLVAALTNFIAALGARYDGDPRIGFITVGLLGFWGEWHTFPNISWFAAPDVQDRVLAASTNAFHQTRLLVRYPTVTGNHDPATLPIGYHDDSFAYSTIAPPSWHFLGLMATARETNKWRTQPIGGEVRPEVQSCMWDAANANCVPAGQDYSNCVALTHASWMLNHGVFTAGFTGEEKARALAGAQQLGYELYVTNAVVVDPHTSGSLQVSVGLLNTGVAPFYYDWPVQLGVLNTSNALLNSWITPWRLSTLPPGTNTLWTLSQSNHGLLPGQFKLVMRVLNPLTNGVPLEFANQAQDADAAGWLTLGRFSVLPDLAPPTLRASASASTLTLQVSNATPGTWTVLGCSNSSFTWVPLLTTNTTTSEWNFTEPIAAPGRFYRVSGSP